MVAIDDPWLDGSQSVTLIAAVGSAAVGLDPTFGTGGYQAVPLKYSLQPSSPDVAVTADSKLLAAAQGVSTDWAVSRVLAAGGPDASFGGTGTVGLTVPRPVG